MNQDQKKTQVVKIQRINGKVVQWCDVYIGRECRKGGWDLPESKWHNPYRVPYGGSAKVAVAQYEKWLMKQPELLKALPELKGKVLGCWCKYKPSDPCHGDVLARLAAKTN